MSNIWNLTVGHGCQVPARKSTWKRPRQVVLYDRSPGPSPGLVLVHSDCCSLQVEPVVARLTRTRYAADYKVAGQLWWKSTGNEGFLGQTSEAMRVVDLCFCGPLGEQEREKVLGSFGTEGWSRCTTVFKKTIDLFNVFLSTEVLVDSWWFLVSLPYRSAKLGTNFVGESTE